MPISAFEVRRQSAVSNKKNDDDWQLDFVQDYYRASAPAESRSTGIGKDADSRSGERSQETNGQKQGPDRAECQPVPCDPRLPDMERNKQVEEHLKRCKPNVQQPEADDDGGATSDPQAGGKDSQSAVALAARRSLRDIVDELYKKKFPFEPTYMPD